MTVSELHALVRAQVRGDDLRLATSEINQLTSSQRAAVAAIRRRVRRSRGRGVQPPAGRNVWGVS